MRMRFLLILSVIVCLAVGYPNGAPEEACQTGAPNHVPHEAMDPELTPCPFLILTEPFMPGVPQIFNITSWNGADTFKGYMLTLFDENNKAMGTFGEKENVICRGAAATHSTSQDKLYAEVEWTPPANSTAENYYVWLTVVRAYSQYWVNCDPIAIPAMNNDVSTTTSDFNTDADGNLLDFTMPPTAPPLPSTVSQPSTTFYDATSYFPTTLQDQESMHPTTGVETADISETVPTTTESTTTTTSTVATESTATEPKSIGWTTTASTTTTTVEADNDTKTAEVTSLDTATPIDRQTTKQSGNITDFSETSMTTNIDYWTSSQVTELIDEKILQPEKSTKKSSSDRTTPQNKPSTIKSLLLNPRIKSPQSSGAKRIMIGLYTVFLIIVSLPILF